MADCRSSSDGQHSEGWVWKTNTPPSGNGSAKPVTLTVCKPQLVIRTRTASSSTNTSPPTSQFARSIPRCATAFWIDSRKLDGVIMSLTFRMPLEAPGGIRTRTWSLGGSCPIRLGYGGVQKDFIPNWIFRIIWSQTLFEEVETMVPFDEGLLEYEVEAERVEEAVEGPVAKPVAQPNPRRKRATKKAIRRPNKKTKTGRGMKIRRPAPRRTTRKARKTRKR